MSESPTIFSILAGEPFIERLASTLLDASRREDLFGACALNDITILLPTHRAVAALEHRLTRAAGVSEAFFLPQIHALGTPEAFGADILNPELIPDAIGLHERQFYLASLIDRWMAQRGQSHSPALSAALAQDLAEFLDEAQADHVDWEMLLQLVPDELARNWQETLSFLAIITQNWPAYLVAEGRIDPVERRNRLLEGLAAFWADHPPVTPIIAAGSTGSQPATASLLARIAQLPKGAVILPGLDQQSADDVFASMAREDSHPQVSMARFVSSMQVSRDQVRLWPYPTAATDSSRASPMHPLVNARDTLLRYAMMPAAHTGHWQNLGEELDIARALQGLRYFEAPDLRTEAGVIALMMRHALETPDKTAALVTPDRNLARRVATELRRWDIIVDDTAGQALRQTMAARFILLILQVVQQQFEPVALLALLKHPWCRLGRAETAYHNEVHMLEKNFLRGPRGYTDLSSLCAAIEAQAQEVSKSQAPAQLLDLAALLRDFDDAIAPLNDMAASAHALSDILPVLEGCVDRLARCDRDSDDAPVGHDQERARILPSDHGGRAILTLFESLKREDVLKPQRPLKDWHDLLTHWFDQTPYHLETSATHPRLAIWGQLEARLMQPDMVILAGLNEGVWPPATETGPWLSRPMRDKMGLRAPERRIGLAAHDFVQNACAPEVVLTRSTKVDGVPTLTSRWIRRLQALCGDLLNDGKRGSEKIAMENYLLWWRTLDRASSHSQFGSAEGQAEARTGASIEKHLDEKWPIPARRPDWSPPAEARPRKLSVTQVETLISDPYQIYARHVLGLREWDDLNPPPSASHRGQFVHGVLESFALEYPTDLPADSAIRMEEIADAHLALGPISAVWQPRLRAIWSWMGRYEEATQHDTAHRFAEIQGSLQRQIGSEYVTLTARADRIDLLKDTTARIIDYKTGQIPSAKDVRTHYSLQLPLEAAIIRSGGFEGFPAASVSMLSYLRLTGGLPAGEQSDIPCDDDQIDGALATLDQLWAHYLNLAHPFLPRLRPKRVRFKSAYDHLSRFDEWGDVEESGETP